MKAVPVMTLILRPRALRAGSLVATAIVLGACAARPPAPVENRTRAPLVRPAPAAAAPISPSGAAPIAPSGAAPIVAESRAAAPAESAGVQTAPVRPSGVETRPLGTPGAAPGTSAGAPAAVPAPAVTIKREPLGRKRPYSETLLADLKAADAQARAEAANRPDAPARPDAGAAAPPAAGGPVASVQPPAAAPAAPAVPGARADAPGEFAWPAKGKVIQGFGESRSTGIAIAAAPGDPVSAAADGKVIFSGQGPRGYGNLIIVKHDADTLSVYAHGRTLLVKEGQTVRKGQKIAEAGDSGADKPKLLFEIRKGGKPVDPLKLLPSK